jgi:phospholipase/carboxylesterase
MPSDTELQQTESGLIYRLRRGQPGGGLIVMLHGLSGDENVMWIFERALPRSATVIAPRALYVSEFGGYSWDRSVVPHDLDRVDFGAAQDVLRQFIPDMIRQYQAAAECVIVMGFSQGAALSYALSLSEPELMCGVIALAGFMPPLDRRKPAQGFPVHGYLIINGLEDEDVPIERARYARSVLEERGAPIEYHEYPSGHKVTAQGLKDITQWLQHVL